MTCSDFLELLSPYRDGLLSDRRVMRRLEQHLRTCVRCQRHARALDQGLGALRGANPIGPSAAFQVGLRQRLAAEVSLGDPVRPTNAGFAAAFLLAAAVGLFVYEGIARPATDVAVAATPPGDSGAPAGLDARPATRADTFDVTLPPFAQTTLEFHSAHAPLGVVAALGR